MSGIHGRSVPSGLPGRYPSTDMIIHIIISVEGTIGAVGTAEMTQHDLVDGRGLAGHAWLTVVGYRQWRDWPGYQLGGFEAFHLD